MRPRRPLPLFLALALPAFAILLSISSPGPAQAGFFDRFLPSRPLTTVSLKADTVGAAAMVSAFRAKHGLGPVKINATLNTIAQRQANGMARTNNLSHTAVGSFPRRMEAGGYNAGIAAENIAGGQRSLAAAMDAWEKSPGHRKNLLLPGITEIGLGLTSAPTSHFKLYWSLVMAGPYRR